jgi:hypothetical protein
MRSNSATHQRLVDGHKSLGDLPGTGQAFRQRVEKSRVTQDEPGLPELVERGTEKPQSGQGIAALADAFSPASLAASSA